jgi:hypothetical protein
MVSQALMEQVLELDAPARRELRDVLADSLDSPVSDGVMALVDQRLAELGPEPAGDSISLEEFEREVWARRTP